ncbi:MAG: cytochrome c maturation protein CcmE [Saprospiraceae bacterium]|nr:cytochrome c maturation protein CcmE [Saprospiraceae bacterium]
MKSSYIIALVLILVSIGIFISASADVSTYATFETAITSQSRVKIAGTLDKNKTMEYDPTVDADRFVFYMSDSDGVSNKVILQKPKPQDFERSEQIVLTGAMQNGAFVADEILMKCPSKYKEEEIALRK